MDTLLNLCGALGDEGMIVFGREHSTVETIVNQMRRHNRTVTGVVSETIDAKPSRRERQLSLACRITVRLEKIAIRQ